MQTHNYDVVIVGAGGAGMRAALESSKSARTAVVTKLYPTRSHTGAAQGGMCAALANVEEDNWEWHTYDTVKGGDYLVDQDAAEVMAKEAIDAVLDLEKMGLPFNRTPEGRIDQRRFGGHTREHGEAPVRRACYAADRTGHMILQTLYQNCVKQQVEFFNEYYVLDVLMTGDPRSDEGVRASGVVTYELASGEIHVFRAKSVVFASGGFGKIFKTTSNAHTLTGDGPAMAFRRGIPLEDMEFFQFHPTGLAGLGILLSEAARGEGGILRNSDMERFMERYAPTLKDLAPRDVVARAMANEVREGRGAGPNKDYVYLDLTHLEPAHIDAKLPDITEFARTYLGVEPYTEPVPVFPTAHYGMGGIPTNIRGEVLRNATDVIPGLYAAGETACVSVHGGNRLGTNSLLDINVFGRRAGIAAAEHAETVDLPELPEGVEDPTVELLERLRDRPATEDRIADIRSELQELMDANVQVFRTDETCRIALDGITRLKKRYETVAI
ncbi:succinate dehydrogenase flavoprotein subunit, partial [Brachybacterium sp. AOP43-C2-M15]|uniref:succinate dehydrogenase flavoprotein subunit n=1 Tax=Brachybacterium sp. AOP43-C2-M15 TaxID=3457661 RepID=UPI0040341858